MANELLARLNSALANDTANRHSLFQLKHFILGKETTVQGRLWQCLREIRVRKDALSALCLEIEDAQDKLELLNISERQIARQGRAPREKPLCKDPDCEWLLEDHEAGWSDQNRMLVIQERMAKRQVEAAEAALESLYEKRKGYEVEATYFVEEFERLNAASPVKDFDDPEAQREFWTAKLFQEVHLKSLLGQPLETDLVKTVLSMPDDSPVKSQMLTFLTSIRDAKVKAVHGEESQTSLVK